MKTGLVGKGYWGNIILSKLDDCSLTPPFKEAEWVFIATPPKSHYEYVKEYILKGKNIFCEKPLTLDYLSAKELIELSKEKNVKLYINNLFLFRDEFKSINYTNFNKIESVWLKEGPFKDTLFNDLLYHDLYMFISLMGIQKITNINYYQNTSNILSLDFMYGNTKIKINYNREWKGNKTKILKFEDQIIDFSYPKNDPLKEVINLCFQNKIDFNQNHTLSLETIKLLNIFTL
jgi:hypothetical protein